VPQTSVIADCFNLIGNAIVLLAAHPAELRLAIAAALLLAGLCWPGPNHYSQLWNLRFRMTALHQLLCLLAALLTLITVVLFASFNYAQAAAEVSIDHWQNGRLQDHEWRQGGVKETYVAVKNLGVEDFSNYPPPDAGGNRIPLTHPESIQRAAQACVDEAISDFRAKHPFLSAIFSLRNGAPAKGIQEDGTDFFRIGRQTYPQKNAVAIALREVRRDLDRQTGRVLSLAWGSLITLFALGQLLPFGWIDYAAYRDLKVTT
jgi:hypothetical protein